MSMPPRARRCKKQLNAERERRATVTKAEGDKRAVELNADAELYEAQKQAEAVRIQAEAEAYATETIAKGHCGGPAWMRSSTRC